MTGSFVVQNSNCLKYVPEVLKIGDFEDFDSSFRISSLPPSIFAARTAILIGKMALQNIFDNICFVSILSIKVPNFNFCYNDFCVLVDTLQKCSYKDGKCIAGMLEDVLKDISKTGIPEFDIPPIDPMDLNDIPVSIFGLLNITLDNGQIKGVKDCMIENMNNDFANGVSTMNITCDVTIKGKFRLDGVSPMIDNLIGPDAIRANGNFKLKLDKLRLKMQYYYHFSKNEDGQIYLICHLDQFNHDFELQNFKLSANKILLMNQDISEFVVSLLNQNWKFLIPTFGRPVFDVAMDIFENILHRFFKAAPVKDYLIDDITSFVKN